MKYYWDDEGHPWTTQFGVGSVQYKNPRRQQLVTEGSHPPPDGGVCPPPYFWLGREAESL